MSNSDRFIKEYAPVPRNAPSDSQSPRAHRASTEDAEAYAKGDVRDGINLGQRVAPENAGASKLSSDLSIESINSRAHRPRR